MQTFIHMHQTSNAFTNFLTCFLLLWHTIKVFFSAPLQTPYSLYMLLTPPNIVSYTRLLYTTSNCFSYAFGANAFPGQLCLFYFTSDRHVTYNELLGFTHCFRRAIPLVLISNTYPSIDFSLRSVYVQVFEPCNSKMHMTILRTINDDTHIMTFRGFST